MAAPVVYNGELPPSSSPLKKIEQALGYGVSAWENLNKCSASDCPHLLSLIYLLEAHTEALFNLCMLGSITYKFQCDIIKRLSGFYSAPNSDNSINPAKRKLSLNDVIPITDASPTSTFTTNYYDILTDYLPNDDDCYLPSDEMKIVIDQKPDERKQSPKRKPIIAATFPEDLGISAVSSFMSRQQQDVEMEEVGNEDAQTEDPPPSVTTIAAQELPSNRYRLNLIRHKFATSTDLSILQLFKVFAAAVKKTDKTMVFLPADSTKQSLSPLMSQKQIDSLTSNHLC